MSQENHSEVHVAAFVDILGFRNLLENAGDDEDQLRDIYNKLNELYSWFESAAYHKEHAQKFGIESARMFSDCVYISTNNLHEIHKNGVCNTLYDHIGFMLTGLALAQGHMAICNHVFLRGGVACGRKITNHSEVEVSSAYYKAYKIESTKAVFPIIMIEEDIASLIPNLPGREAYREEYPNDHLVRHCVDFDGNQFYCLDYLWILSENLDEGYTIENMLMRHKEAIVNSFNEISCNRRIKEKYRWLALHYHNEVVKDFYNAELITDKSTYLIEDSIVDLLGA